MNSAIDSRSRIASLFALSLACCLALSSSAFASIWINEFDYDQAGTDNAEFIELVASPGMSISLNDIVITLYNGANSLSYESIPGTSFTIGAVVNGYQFYNLDFSPTTDNLQNGSSDGIALSLAGVLQEFISYEGALTPTNGPAAGITSVNVGVSENNSVPNLSVARIGVGSQAADFIWASVTPTLGSTNPGQSLVPQQTGSVPEASAFLVWSLLCGCVLTGLKRTRDV